MRNAYLILLIIYSLASFGFLGSRTIDVNSDKIEGYKAINVLGCTNITSFNSLEIKFFFAQTHKYGLVSIWNADIWHQCYALVLNGKFWINEVE